MKKVTIPTEIQGIDWSQKQWMQHVTYSDLIVLTTGQNLGRDFTGTALPCKSYPNGDFDTKWDKFNFKPLTTDIPFTISNSNG